MTKTIAAVATLEVTTYLGSVCASVCVCVFWERLKRNKSQLNEDICHSFRFHTFRVFRTVRRTYNTPYDMPCIPEDKMRQWALLQTFGWIVFWMCLVHQTKCMFTFLTFLKWTFVRLASFLSDIEIYLPAVSRSHGQGRFWLSSPECFTRVRLICLAAILCPATYPVLRAYDIFGSPKKKSYLLTDLCHRIPFALYQDQVHCQGGRARHTQIVFRFLE